MSGPFGAGGLQLFGAGGFYPYSIDQSLRFEDGDSAYLTRTFGSASNQRTWTWSAWIKRGNLGGSVVRLFNANDAGSPFRQTSLRFDSDQLRFFNDSTGTAYDVKSTQVFRDPSAWYNIVLAIDTTSGTASNRVKMYVNGSQITDLATSTYPAQNVDTYVNAARSHQIGASVTPSQHFDGYMAEVNFIDGSQLDPTSFGETKAGIWIPKDTSNLTFGTNGFRLKFQDSSALGDDTSGNGNDFTASGLAATDVVLDSPTNNWCTINSASSIGTQSEGNLKQVTASTGSGIAVGSIGQTSGKWYWEVNVNNSSSADLIGVVDETLDSVNSGSYVGYLTSAGEDSIAYYSNGNRYINGSAASYGATFTTGDIIGVALNLDDNEITFYKNNSSQGAISYTFSGGNILPAVCDGTSSASLSTFILNFGQDSSFAGTETAQGNTDANGKGDFYYSPPSGFLCLASVSLPDPAIDPAQNEEPADYFNTVLYTGDGASNKAITGVGFQPDFVWIKGRSSAGYNNVLNDSVRGGTKTLFSNETLAEYTDRGVGTFDTDGFTFTTYNGDTNNSGVTYVAWNWLAGGTASSNTDGSITSSVSANTEAGFSICSFTSNGSASVVDIGHGLDSTPEMVIWKNRDATSYWFVYHKDLTSTQYYLQLHDTAAEYNAATAFFSVSGTTMGIRQSSLAVNGNDCIAYAFHSVDGYSKVGSYTGNGSSDGPFIYTGFRVAWLLTKATSTTSSWGMFDSVRDVDNVSTQLLLTNSSNAESTASGGYDLLSNGFKIRDNGLNNTSGQTYIYLAFAEQPFKYANAR